MSKGLEELEKLGNEYPSEGDTLWSQYSERFSIIEQELKEGEENAKYKRAWEIVIEKNVDVYFLKFCGTLSSYNDQLQSHEIPLEQEEFDLLKEVLYEIHR